MNFSSVTMDCQNRDATDWRTVMLCNVDQAAEHFCFIAKSVITLVSFHPFSLENAIFVFLVPVSLFIHFSK